MFGGTVSVRHLTAALGAVGMAIVYGLKVNLSVAIVSMVNHTFQANENPDMVSDNLVCPGTVEVHEDGPFAWPSNVEGAVLSSYFWGYILAQFPGARLAEMYSAKMVMFFAVVINTAGTLLTPIAAKMHYDAVVALRMCLGIGGGVTLPAMHVLLAKWTPPQERGLMATIVYSGTAIGTTFSMSTASMIASYMGWEYIFYLMGAISAVWLLFWAYLVTDDPRDHPLIKPEEQAFIIQSLGETIEKKDIAPVPWRAIIASEPVAVLAVTHLLFNWGWYTTLIELPKYIKYVLKFGNYYSGPISGVPFLFMWLFSIWLSMVLTRKVANDVISRTSARKIATGVCCGVPMICFGLLNYVECRRYIALVLITIAITAMGGMYSGFLVNHIDLAPNYAGTLMAITNTFGTMTGIIVPIVFADWSNKFNPRMVWEVLFWTTIFVYLLAGGIFVLFGSATEQPWNDSCYNKCKPELLPLKSTQGIITEYEATEKPPVATEKKEEAIKITEATP